MFPRCVDKESKEAAERGPRPMMNDRQRLRRLNEALDASEAEVANIDSEIAAHHDDADADMDELKRRRNLAQAKANALQAVFESDFFQPRKNPEL